MNSHVLPRQQWPLHSARVSVLARQILIYSVLSLFTLLQGYPIVWVVLNALKQDFEIFANPWGLPQQPLLDNFVRAWQKVGIGIYFKNTLITTVGTVLLVLLVGGLASYALARGKLPYRRLIYGCMALGLVIRPEFTLPGLFIVSKNLHLLNTYLGLILAYTAAGLPMAIILFTPYFETLPIELEEAAVLDGANALQVLIRVVIPLSSPVISAVTIFTSLFAYNELIIALIIISDIEKRTLPLGITLLISSATQRDYSALFAALATTVMPVIALYLVFQRRFISGLTSGALKR